MSNIEEKPLFVYVIYIASTPEKVFEALTDPTMAQHYWDGNRVQSDWTVGAPFALKLKREERDITGKVLEGISRGWPLVMSSLKSYPESRRVLRAPWYEDAREGARP